MDICPDLLFVYRCPFIISKKAYSTARFGAYNIHPSLLPNYCGLNPWYEIFKNNEVENGVTLHRITDVVDGGEIIYQQSYRISPNDTIEYARNNADVIASKLLARFMDEYIPEHDKFLELYPLPNKYDYIEAITDKSNLLIENAIKNGLSVEDINGNFHEGAYSIVFKIKFHNKELALRCWKCICYDDCVTLCRRMMCISNELREIQLPYFMDFNFYERGIVTSKGIYPIMLMDWTNDLNLKQYISENLSNPEKLYMLANNFTMMAADLHTFQISHGDLQHGNILVNDAGKLILVDYDSMYVPALEGFSDDIKGLDGYQHPARRNNPKLTPKADYFSELIIYASLIALAKMPQLWEELGIEDTETLLFSAEDIESKGTSSVFQILDVDEELGRLSTTIKSFIIRSSINDLKPLEEVVISPLDTISSKWENNGYKPIVPNYDADADEIQKKWRNGEQTASHENLNIDPITNKW